jgi:hypothetical protein
VDKRLREEFGKLQVEINDEKSRTVDLERGECFGFLGFEFRYLRGLSGAMRPHYTPKLKKRTALVRALKEVFGRHRSQPIERVIALINPVLRGWVNYFAVGHSSECFSFIKDWVEKKVRRHLAHARREANGGAQCGKSARCVRRGGGWRRGVGRDLRATPARQPSTLLMSGDGKRSVAEWPKLPRPSSTLPGRSFKSRFGAVRGHPRIFQMARI